MQRQGRRVGRLLPNHTAFLLYLVRWNVEPIVSRQTSQAETGLAGWACRTRTRKCLFKICYLKCRKRGKGGGSQAVARRGLTILGKYGTSGWLGTAGREPR